MCIIYRSSLYYAVVGNWSYSSVPMSSSGASSSGETSTSAGPGTSSSSGVSCPIIGVGSLIFNPKNNPKYIFQKLDPVKQELVFDGRLAIASTYDHRSYFGDAFQLTRDGQTLSSGCIAFGMERWLSAFVHSFGEDSESWPTFKVSDV